MRSVLAALCCVVVSPAWSNLAVPPRDAPVIDQTGTLDARTVNALQFRLIDYAQSSGNQIAVLLVPDTAPEDLDAYGERVLRAWNLGGDPGRGALLLWSAAGTITLAVAPGLQAQLPVAARVEIFRHWIIPRFADGDADEGIRAGVERIIAVLAGEPVGAPAATDRRPAHETVAPVAPTDDAPTADDDSNAGPALGVELDTLAQNLDRRPGETLAAVLASAGAQWRELPQRVRELAAAPTNVASIALYVLGALALLAAILLLLGKPAAAALWLGLPGAVGLWFATGDLALSLCLAAGALIFCLLLPLLRLLVGRADPDARLPDIGGNAQNQVTLRQQQDAQRQLSARMRRTAVSAAQSKAALPPPTAARHPRADARPATTAATAAAVVGAVSRVRTWQIVLAIALFMVNPIYAGILIVILALRSGLKWKALSGGNLRSAMQQRIAQMRDDERARQQQRRGGNG